MFIAITKYTKPLEEVDIYRPAHQAHIKKAIQQDLILVTGRRTPSHAGGMIISQQITKAQFEEFMQKDPFVKAQVATYEIFEFNPAMYADNLKPLIEKTGETTTAVPLPTDESLPTETKEFLHTLPALNVYRMFANIPRSLPPFIQLAKSFLVESKFSIQLLEVGILRVAHLTKSPYEWHQHEIMAKANGVTDDEIEIIRTENSVKSLSEEKNFICKIADEITLNVNLKDETFNQLYSRYSKEQGLQLVLCLSFYNMLSRFLNATRVPIEAVNPLAGRGSPV